MPDQLAAASGMHVDAAGVVTYDFEGHVHATGLDLDAGPITGPLPPNLVAWLSPLGRVGQLGVGGPGPGNVGAYSEWGVDDAPGDAAAAAGVRLSTDGAGARYAQAFANPYSVTVIDSADQSNFVAVGPGLRKWRMYGGDGTVSFIGAAAAHAGVSYSPFIDSPLLTALVIPIGYGFTGAVDVGGGPRDFTAIVETLDGSPYGGDVDFYWIAIGE